MNTEITQKRIANPRQNASFLCVASFGYTLPLFFKGRKKELHVEDLYETWSAHQTTKLANTISTSWKLEKLKAAEQNREPSLGKVLLRMHATEMILFGLLTAFNEVVVKVLQPLALGELINYYTSNQNASINEACLYAGVIVGCSFLSVLLSHPAVLGASHVGMKLRISCCTLIYRHTLKMTQMNLEHVSAGKIINLLANDVNRFDHVSPFLNTIWVGPLQTIVVTYFVYREVGVSGILAIVAFLMFIPIQFILGKLLATYRRRTAIKTDQRVKLINEIITGIQVIKMYAWEYPYQKIAELTRSDEMNEIRKATHIRGVFTALIGIPNRIGIFAAIMIYMGLGGTINARQAFILTAYFNVIKPTMAIYFPVAIFMLAEVTVSIKRITEFLLTDFGEEPKSKEQILNNKYAVTIENGSAKWKESVIFSNIDLKIKRGNLVAIVGPVGSGKSSIFQALLKELPLTAGTIHINGKISYSSQQPWLYTGTVRQNILFNSPMDKQRYKSVVSACALKTDFSILPYADKTIVGERGVSLSGGQKARINLARAVYNNADVYLLDDPLSAVDAHVGKQLFNECISGFLSEKTVILITHQLQYLKDVDHIVVIDSGMISAQGTYKELQTSGIDFTKLLEKTEEDVNEDEKNIRRVSVQSVISVDQELIPGVLEESQCSGTVSSTVYSKYITGARSPFLIFTAVLLLLVAQILSSLMDYFITYWTNLEQRRKEENFDDPQENIEKNFWDFSTDDCMLIYSTLLLSIILVLLIRSYAFYQACFNASKFLYLKMLHSILRAKLLFFNTNPSGRILNRFSSDFGLVDEKLPSSVFMVLQFLLLLISVVVMVGIINPWMLIIAGIITIIVYLMASFYLKTSRNIKRIEGITRSPVYAHVNATLQGLPTIRAFNAVDTLEKEFDRHLDLHSSAWYTFLSSSTAFGYWLDLVALIYIGVVTFSFIIFGNEQYGGNVGLAVSQAMILTGMFQVTMKEMAEVENLMTSVERITEYSTIESEPALDSDINSKPPKTWPYLGEVEFRNVYFKYAPEHPHVLKNVNFIIQPMEKVGIVGRTGAGKSSLIAALFRLTEIEGSIIIDHIDIKNIGLHDLRSKITIIPQDPVVFSGTMRRNLDPFNEYPEDVLWNALEQVELKEVVSNLSGGLDAEIQEAGTNLSVGQRQLVCLARAILRNNKILVLDEATANVDQNTDNLVQKTIRKKFYNCTVITIAHRINTIMDSDKVLVMDSGCMVEFDHPYVLLQNKNGVFYSMVEQNSKGTFDALFKIAETNYYKLVKKEEEPSTWL